MTNAPVDTTDRAPSTEAFRSETTPPSGVGHALFASLSPTGSTFSLPRWAFSLDLACTLVLERWDKYRATERNRIRHFQHFFSRVPR
jgi:hypothetical protein